MIVAVDSGKGGMGRTSLAATLAARAHDAALADCDIASDASAAKLAWAGRISYDHAVTQAQRRRKTIAEYGGDRSHQEVRAIWNAVSILFKTAPVGEAERE